MTTWPATPLVSIDERDGSGSENIAPLLLPVKCSAATSGSSSLNLGDSVVDSSSTTAPYSQPNYGILNQLDVVHAGQDGKRLHGNGTPAIIKCQFSPLASPQGSLTFPFPPSSPFVSPSAPVTAKKQEAFIAHKNFTSDKKNPSKGVGPISGDVTRSRTRSDVGCVPDKNATNNSTRGHRSTHVTSHAGTAPGPAPLSLSSSLEESLSSSAAESRAAVDSSKSVTVLPSTRSSLSDVCTAATHSSRGELQSGQVSGSDRKRFTVEAKDECHSGSLESRDTRDISFEPHQQNRRRHSSSGLRHKNYTKGSLWVAQSDLDLRKQSIPDGVGLKLSQARSIAPSGTLSQRAVDRVCRPNTEENYELINQEGRSPFADVTYPDSSFENFSTQEQRENFKITKSDRKSRNEGSSLDEENRPDLRFINDGQCSSTCCTPVKAVTYDVSGRGMIDVSLCHSGGKKIDPGPSMVSEGGIDSSFPSPPFYDDVTLHSDQGDAPTSRLSAAAPSIQVTTTSSSSSLTEATPRFPEINDTSAESNESVSAAFEKSSGAQPSKLRDTFINGLRRLSREKNTFLRIDQSYNCGRPSADSQDRSSSGRTFLFPGPQTHLSNSPAGRAAVVGGGPGERRKLKVEFAVMEEEGHKLSRSKVRGARMEAGVKDEVDNHVAMLGGSSARFRQPRVSLLGKPLNYRAHRRDMRYRRIQARIYNFLERPKHWGSWMYHFVMFAFVLLCLTLGVLSSISELEPDLIHSTVYLELIMLLWIAIELGLRVWSAGCRSRHQGLTGRLRFLRRPLCIIDIILVIASVTTMIVGTTQEHFPQAVLSGLRFFQILRMVRMDRKGGTWKLLGSVVWAHRQELVTTLYIGLLGLIFSSYFVYLAEKDEPKLDSGNNKQYNSTGYKPKFSNFADAIWWGVVTLCTVGYGDVVPASWGGKLIAAFSAILGISFFALPAGILGSGFALKVQQQQRQKHLNRRRVPAANLIQCLWRCYAADEHSISTATWKPHMIPCPSPPSERSFKNNTSFVSRFSTRRRDRSSTINSNSSHTNGQAQSPMTVRHHSRRTAISTSDEEVPNVLDRSHLSLATGLTDHKLQLDMLPFKKENSVTSIGKESEDEPDLSPRLTQLTDQHKKVIRAIRKMKYFVARRKFREALRPYDVKDVIEQYSAGHVDMLGRIKNLQGRLDQILGRQGSKSKDVYESKICLASRIVKVERQVDDIETKIDLLVDMYKEDRKLLLQHLHQSCPVPGSGSDQPPPPPPSASTTTTSNTPQFKPRPILVEKQFTSEPATPTALNFPGSYGGGGGRGKPIIQRNLSDLSQRIKKRVTYHPLSLHDPPSRAQSAASFTNSVAMSSIFSNTSDNQSFQQSLAHTPPSDVPPLLPDRCLQSDDQPEREVAIDGTPSAELQSSLKPRDFQSHKLLHQPSSISLPPISSTTLSTLSEQRSVESDSSLSCGELGQGSSLSPAVNNSASSEQTLPTLPPMTLLLASANQLKESHCRHGDRRSSALFPPASAQTTSTTEDMSESDRQDLLHNITV